MGLDKTAEIYPIIRLILLSVIPLSDAHCIMSFPLIWPIYTVLVCRKKSFWAYCKAAVLDLGYRYTQGYLRRSQGVPKIKKKSSKEARLGRFFDLGVREGHITLICGYAEVYNLYLGVCGYQNVESPCCKVFCQKKFAVTCA